MDIWERQDKESEPAHAAFQVYRDQPKSERSIRRVAQSLDKSATLIGGWSRQWQWVARVAAWDAERERLDDEAIIEAQREYRLSTADNATELTNRVMQELVGRDLAGESTTSLILILKDLSEMHRRGVGADGGGSGKSAGTGKGGPQSFVKLYEGVDTSKM